MKQFNIKYLFITAALLAGLSSCRKDRSNPEPIVPGVERAGVYILNQGGFSANNSTLTYIDYVKQEVVPDRFAKENGRGLGAVGNDIAQYGSKIYIVVNVSKTLEVIDAKTAKSIKRIEFGGGASRQPRYIVFNKNKAFVSLYDGNVAVIDTAGLTVEKDIKVGNNPEQMVITNNKLYVANSGGLSETYDKTVSVIDLNTLTETKKITVVENPNYLAADRYGDLYVLSIGNYKEIASAMTIINTATDVVKDTKPQSIGYGNIFTIMGDYGYIITADNKIKVINTKTEATETENFITDGTTLTTPSAIAIDNIEGLLFVADANNYAAQGSVVVFNGYGRKQGNAIPTGSIPGKILFVNK